MSERIHVAYLSPERREAIKGVITAHSDGSGAFRSHGDDPIRIAVSATSMQALTVTGQSGTARMVTIDPPAGPAVVDAALPVGTPTEEQ